MIIGVMGYSGSGKSTFSEALKNMGAYIIDADKIGKDILKKGSLSLKKVTELFGKEYLLSDGSLNRKKLGDLVFSDEKKLELLNSITVKEIEKQVEADIKKAKKEIVVIDCALLPKIKAYSLCDEVVYIDCFKKNLIERIVKREGISKKTAENRLKNQKMDFKKYATIIIKNNGINDLQDKAACLMKGWLK